MDLDDLKAFLKLHNFDIKFLGPGKLWVQQNQEPYAVFRSEWLHGNHSLQYSEFRKDIILAIERRSSNAI